ncbi:MAG: DUF2065 domain-containing protein [Oleiphilaceae bacterium]|nr:DUF2065 domain-containing protein [Oleiphilaceae bacterium]
MWQQLLVALGLVLIIEGMLPFLAPQRWQALIATLAAMDPRSIRIAGLASMLAGLLIVMLVR